MKVPIIDYLIKKTFDIEPVDHAKFAVGLFSIAISFCAVAVFLLILNTFLVSAFYLIDVLLLSTALFFMVQINIRVFSIGRQLNWKRPFLSMERNNTRITVKLKTIVLCSFCHSGALIPKEAPLDSVSPYFYECSNCGHQIKG